MNINNGWLLAFTLILSVVACRKVKDQQFDQIRMFSPGLVTVSSGETKADLSWSPSLFTEGKAVKYTVQFSKDSSFSTIDYSMVVDSAKATVTDNELAVRTTYIARIKADSSAGVPQSKWVLSAPFRLSGEQIFLPIMASDIIDNAVVLKWRATPGLTKITLTPAGGTAFDVTLTPADVAANQKVISGLQSGKQYTAEIFAGTKSKGVTTFTTAAPISGNLVDLRGITGRPSVLADTLPVIPAGSIVILERGQTYTISSAISLSKTVTIMSGTDLFNPALANIYFTSNFNFTAGSTIDSIKFSSVSMRSDNWTSRYIFNTTGGATVGKMIFENSRIGAFRGMARLQSGTTTVGEFRVDNCVIDSLGNYGVLTVDNVSCKVDNIIMRNSTVWRADKVFTSRQNSVSVVVDKNTFNETPLGGGSNYLIDYSTSGTNNVTNGITFTNNILGVGRSNAGNVTVRGLRVNTTTAITSTNNYKTADYVTAGNDFPGLIAYSGTSFDLWVDPANGNFRFKDASFAGRNTAGDPRWRQ
jgi:hypothetical protein